ncbi:MAG: alanine racemase [Brevinema sp.]
MFSDILLKNNPELTDYALFLHKNGLIQPDTYVLDYDRILQNYQMILKKAQDYRITPLVMTKQFGRHPLLIQGLSELGAEFVTVDFREAQQIIRLGAVLGHIGHLVQIPLKMIPSILQYRPKLVTIYSLEQAHTINEYAKSQNFIQNIMLRVIKTAYPGQQTARYTQKELLAFAKQLQRFPYIHLIGMTSFPCFLLEQDKIIATDNAQELTEHYNFLNSQGYNLQIKNMPSHNNYSSIPLASQWGATQIEPGHALTGTCPYHKAFPNIQEEKIAIAYISEVSHQDKDISYIYGGGYYRRSQWEYVYTAQKNQYPILPLDPYAIDYTIGVQGKIPVGETIISSFRTQIFVTRSQIALIKGLSTHSPTLVEICNSQGRKV